MKNNTPNKKDINIVLITDNGYIVPTAVTIQSIINNTNKSRNYTISVLCDNVSSENKKFLKDCENSAPNVKVAIVDANLDNLKGLHDSKNGNFMVATTTALLKFNIADIFYNLDKVLYLDGDLLVKCDVAEIFDNELNENIVAAVRDTPQVFFDKQDFGEDRDYFNSGIMLLNTKLMREEKTKDLLIKTKKESVNDTLMDQNVLNKVFRGRVLQLDLAYNVPFGMFSVLKTFDYKKINNFYSGDFKSIDDLKRIAKIIHFSSFLKPWIFYDSPYADEWYDVYKQTPLKNIPLNRFTSQNQTLQNFKRLKKSISIKNEQDKLSPRGTYKFESKISIIIPVFNASEYIKDCYESIKSQTLQDIEFLFVNDGSSDNSVELLNEFKQIDNRVKIIDLKENRGTSYARKIGVEKATGKYILFLDPDDEYDNSACEKLYEIMENINTDVLMYGTKVVSHSSNAYDVKFFENMVRPKYTDLLLNDIVYKGFLDNNISINIWNKVYNAAFLKQVFKKINDRYLILAEDYYASFLIMFYAKSFISIQDPFYIYHTGRGITWADKTITQTKFDNGLQGIIIRNLIIEFLNSENSLLNNLDMIKNITHQRVNIFTPTFFRAVKSHLKEYAVNAFLSELFLDTNTSNKQYNEFASKLNVYSFKLLSNNINYHTTENVIVDVESFFEENIYKPSKFKEYYESNIKFLSDKNSLTKTENVIPVVLSTNNNFAKFVGVTIQSIKENASPNDIYHIYVFHDDDMTMINKLKLESLTTSNIIVKCLNVAPLIDTSSLYAHSHFSLQTFYRWWIPEILPQYKKVIYIDCDLVVNADLREFYNIDLEGKIVGGIIDPTEKIDGQKIDFFYNYIQNTLKLNPYKYINAGVLLIDSEKFNQAKIKDKCIDVIRSYKKLECLDQDALNITLVDNIKFIDNIWNFQTGNRSYDKLEKYDHIHNIIHFTTSSKPWKSVNASLCEYFWKYAKNSIFYEEILSMYLSSTLKINTNNINDVNITNETLNKYPLINNCNMSRNMGKRKKCFIFWPFRMIKAFFKNWKLYGFKFTCKKVGIKIKYVINRLLKRVDSNNNPI